MFIFVRMGHVTPVNKLLTLLVLSNGKDISVCEEVLAGCLLHLKQVLYRMPLLGVSTEV